MRRRPRAAFLVALCLATMFALLLVGSGVGATRSTFAFRRLDEPKLDSQLGLLAQSTAGHGAATAMASARRAGLEGSATRVRVVVVSEPNSNAAARGAVTAAGGTIEGTAGPLTEALVPPASLVALSQKASVADVRPPLPHAAAAVDEAVHLTDADTWHTAGYGGAGVKIGIVDLGFSGYSSLLGTALPSSVTTIDHCSGNLAAAPPTGTDHGTAVAELVHQMAPDAQLYLICVDSEVGLAQAEQDAIADGIKIINHSVVWFNSSRGDGSGTVGTPDAIVADARAHGILWVNAAGNEQVDHYSAVASSSQQFVTFPGGAPFDEVTIQSGETACAYLKWDAWPVTTQDLDLLLVQLSDSTVVAGSANDQADGPAPPTEGFCYTNTGATQSFGIAVESYAVVGSVLFDLYYDGSSPLAASDSSSVPEPASSPDALAVGAECWGDNAPEFYSSQGPTIDGRIKPDLMAQDNVSTVTYGAANGCTLGSTGFAGTSAAAPQVAGAAALLLQHDPSLTPGGITAALEAAASRVPNDQLPVDVTDNVHGNGLLSLPPLTPQQQLAVDVDGFAYGTGTAHLNGLITMNADGSGARFVAVEGTAATNGVSWSLDGRTLAFSDGAQTTLVGADATNPTP